MSFREAFGPLSERITSWLTPRPESADGDRGGSDVVVGPSDHVVELEVEPNGDDYADFVSRLNSAEGALVPNLHKHLARFKALHVADMAPEGRDSPQAVFHRLVQVYGDKLALHPSWQSDGAVTAVRARSCTSECLERWLAVRVYDVVFRALPAECTADQALWRRCRALDGVLQACHLDLPAECTPSPAAAAWYRAHVLGLPLSRVDVEIAPGGDAPVAEGVPASTDGRQGSSWQAVAAQLRDWHMFKCPRDKLVAVANMCRLLCGIIAVARAGGSAVIAGGGEAMVMNGGSAVIAVGVDDSARVATSEDGAASGGLSSSSPSADRRVSPATADDLLPAVVLTLVAMPSPCLQSLLAYCRKYRRQEGLRSELGYYLLNLELAASFLADLEPKQLTGWEGGDTTWRAALDANTDRAQADWVIAACAVAPTAATTASAGPSAPMSPGPCSSPLPSAAGQGFTGAAGANTEVPSPASCATGGDATGLSALAAALVPPVAAVSAAQLPEAIDAWLDDRCALLRIPRDVPLSPADVDAVREEYGHLAASMRALMAVYRRTVP